MELDKHICTQLVEKAKAFTQITLEDDYIIRDNKPDVVRVIYTKGDVVLEDMKEGNQVIWLTGKLRFSALYQSDDEDRRLESVTGEIPFQEKLVMDEGNEIDKMSIRVSVEDLSIGIINSRKLVVRAILNVTAKCMEEESICFCGRILESEVQQKTVEVPVLCLVENKQDVVHMQKEMLLPNMRSNIGEIIFYQVDFRNEEVELHSDAATLQMDALIWVLYRSENTGEYECYETTVSLNAEMECDRLQGDEIFWSTLKPVEVTLEPRGDYDGESRMLGVEVAMEVGLQIYREENCEILQDAYAMDKELHMEKVNLPFYQLLVKNMSKIRLMEQDRIEANQERILQICGSSGSITIDRVQKRENGIQVEGLLSVHIVYNTTEDRLPFSHTMTQIPFEQFIEVDGMTDSVHYWIDAKVEQLQVNLLDNVEYEVKAILEIGLLVMKNEMISNILSVREENLDMEALQKQPGMIGCVRKEGEDLWDIAKKYHATEDNIIEIGNKVLVVKQVY